MSSCIKYPSPKVINISFCLGLEPETATDPEPNWVQQQV